VAVDQSLQTTSWLNNIFPKKQATFSWTRWTTPTNHTQWYLSTNTRRINSQPVKMKVDSGQELNKYHRITVWNANATTKAYEMQHEAETIMALQWMNWSDTFFQATTTRCHAGWTGVSKSYWESGLCRSKRLPQRYTHLQQHHPCVQRHRRRAQYHTVSNSATSKRLQTDLEHSQVCLFNKPKKQKRLDQPQKCAPS